MSWTDERTALLKTLWLNGLSASQIAGELGDVTRNAVIGKVTRLGLSGRGQPASVVKRQRPRRRTYARGVFTGARAPETATHTVERRAPIVVPVALMLGLNKLTEQTCKFPIGDPAAAGFGFCGCPAEEKLPYCLYHCSIAYSAEAPRRRPETLPVTRGRSERHIVFDAGRSGAWR